MAPIMRSVVAQVSRGGGSVISRRKFCSDTSCSKCGRSDLTIAESLKGTAITACFISGGPALFAFVSGKIGRIKGDGIEK